MEDSKLAAALSIQLAERIGAQRFELWFKTQAQLCVEAGRLTIRSASAFVRDWLRNHFADDVRACWESIAGQSGTVEFELDAATIREGDAPVEPLVAANVGSAGAPPSQSSSESKTLSGVCDSGPIVAPPASQRPATVVGNAFDLASFIVGASNEYAFRAAELTARGRQQASPLTFCGPTGVGKTHLLRAIIREYRRRHPRSGAVYLSAEQFTTGFVQAVRGSGMPSFRQKCRGAQLLAIDDVQFFAGKRRTLEELLHTLDWMATEGRQFVLASDRELSELRALGPELVSRLAGGLICEIQPPEHATRLGILRQLRDEAGLVVEDAVLSLIAQHVTEGARELRGALHRLEAMSHAFDEPISREMAERAIADMARHTTRPVRLADVQKAVCEVFHLEAAQLRSERKGRYISEPRMLAMWLARKYTRAPWSEIGQYFGRRSHSTVISAHRRVEKLITSHAQIGVADASCNVEEAIRRLETALRTG